MACCCLTAPSHNQNQWWLTIRDVQWHSSMGNMVRGVCWPSITKISFLIIIASDNGFWLGRRQAIIWSNAGILLIWPLGTNFREILIEIHISSFKKIHLKLSSAKCRPLCHGLNALSQLTSFMLEDTDQFIVSTMVAYGLGPLSLTWINMDR